MSELKSVEDHAAENYASTTDDGDCGGRITSNPVKDSQELDLKRDTTPIPPLIGKKKIDLLSMGDCSEQRTAVRLREYLDDKRIERRLREEVLNGHLDLGRLIAEQLRISDLREETPLAQLALHVLKQKLPHPLGADDSVYERLFSENLEDVDETDSIANASLVSGSDDGEEITAKTVAEIIRTRGLKMSDLSSPEMLSAVAEYLAIKHPELDLDIEPNLCERLFTGEWAERYEAALNAPPADVEQITQIRFNPKGIY